MTTATGTQAATETVKTIKSSVLKHVSRKAIAVVATLVLLPLLITGVTFGCLLVTEFTLRFLRWAFGDAITATLAALLGVGAVGAAGGYAVHKASERKFANPE